MNRKGHVGIGLTVIFAIILVGGALYSFAIYRDGLADTKAELRTLAYDFTHNKGFAIATLKLLVQESIYASNASTDFKTDFENALKQRVEAFRNDDKYGNLFGKVYNKDGYSLNENNGNYTLELFGVEIKSSSGQSGAEVGFDVAVTFNREKVLSFE